MGTKVEWARGQKIRQWIPVPGSPVEIPITAIGGAQSGPLVLVTGGVHGGEYAGIAAAVELAQTVDPAIMAGRLLIVHLANPPAFHAKTQYLNPLDGQNLNRVFPGTPEGSASERMAAVLMAWAQTADAWIDLHSGDIHEALAPFTIYADVEGEVGVQARRLAEAYGIPRLVASAAIAGGSYAAAAHCGIPAILAEAGGCGQVERPAIDTHVRGVQNVLAALGMGPRSDRTSGERLVVYRRFEWVRAETAGLWYRQRDVSAYVPEGEVIGELRDAFGDVQATMRSPVAGEVLFVATSLAINAGDPLFAVGAA